MSGCTNTTYNNVSKNKPGTSTTHVSADLKLRSVVQSVTCGSIHAAETGLQSDVRSCIVSGLPMLLVQELNAGNVR